VGVAQPVVPGFEARRQGVGAAAGTIDVAVESPGELVERDR